MEYFDLGTYARKITTGSKEAQVWFDRGLIWTYAFNHKEAITCYERAIRFDPTCAMPHWGIAYALGANYNKPWSAFQDAEKSEAIERAQEAIMMANLLKDGASAAEAYLIDAMSLRYPSQVVEDITPYHKAYANKMREAYKQHSDDLDVCCIFADALMNLTPWKLWDLQTGKPADGANTLEAVKVLETAFDSLDGAWSHPGLLHMYLHAMEMSPHPERALKHGDALSTLAPDAGHLCHMATHIDILCGDYHSVVGRNTAAVLADRKFRKEKGAYNFYTLYQAHNLHFKIYGAMFLGQPTAALEAADELVSIIPKDLILAMPNWFESFVSMKQHALIRFGKWGEILAQDLPRDVKLYTMTCAMMHYARTIALANTGKSEKAEEERKLFLEAKEHVSENRMLFNNSCTDLLAIAEQMMLGEVEYHKGNYDKAFKHLRKSVELDDNLPYDEPWGWMQPTRHALGALLIEQGQYQEAEAVYRADLGLDSTVNRACQHPGNVWSLHGLNECLIHRGDSVELRHIKPQLDKAVARAEVPIRASCYCRKNAANQAVSTELGTVSQEKKKGRKMTSCHHKNAEDSTTVSQ